jgi:hypothetical protein
MIFAIRSVIHYLVDHKERASQLFNFHILIKKESQDGATAVSKMTLRILTFSIMIFSIMKFSKMTLRI